MSDTNVSGPVMTVRSGRWPLLTAILICSIDFTTNHQQLLYLHAAELNIYVNNPYQQAIFENCAPFVTPDQQYQNNKDQLAEIDRMLAFDLDIKEYENMYWIWSHKILASEVQPLGSSSMVDHVKSYPHLVWSPHKLRVVLRQTVCSRW